MLEVGNRAPLKSTVPQVSASIFRAAPKSRFSRRVPPGWLEANEQPWLYAAASTLLAVVPYTYHACTALGAARAVGGAASNAPTTTAYRVNLRTSQRRCRAAVVRNENS